MEKMAYLGIVPEHAHNHEFKDSPIGSGPYKLVQWDKGQQAIFQRNEEYYGEMPEIEKLTIVFLDTDTAYLAVKNGDVDVAQINGTLATEAKDMQIINVDSIECYGICFPMIPESQGEKTEEGYSIGNDITSDIYIRKALNAAVDRQGIVDGILNGYGSVSTTGLEKMPWLNEDTALEASEYNSLEQAKSILEEGNWKDSDGDGFVEKDGKNLGKGEKKW